MHSNIKVRNANELVWLQAEPASPLQAARHFDHSEQVRDWRVMMALAEHASSRHQLSSQTDLANAFERVAYGVKSGQIVIDYVPADAATMDIPGIDAPEYLQAVVYWSVRMGCSMSTLCEAHARLGRRPSVRNTYAAVVRIEGEENGMRAWVPTTDRAQDAPQTRPAFEATRPYRH